MGFEIKNGVLKKYTEERNVTNIVIPDEVTRIDYSAFQNCKTLTSVTIPDGVKEIRGWAFERCERLTSVTIPDSVKKIGCAAFRSCTGLTSVALPANMTRIESFTFAFCGKLAAVTIPEHVTYIGASAFLCCDSLTSVRIPEGVDQISYQAFHRTPWLEHQKDTFVIAGNHILVKYNGEASEVSVPDGVRIIGDEAFRNHTELVSVKMPDSVTAIGISAFRDCKGLTSVTIPDSVKEIKAHAFTGTPWLAHQKEEFVIAGDHVLIDYNGNDAVIHIPDEITYFDLYILSEWGRVSKVVWHDVVYEKFRRDPVRVEEIIRMVMQKDYAVTMDHAIKYSILWKLFCKNPNAELDAYIKKSFNKMFQYAIDTNETDVIEVVCKRGKLLTKKNIDKFLDYAIEKKRTAVEFMLMQYKNEHSL